MAKITIDTKKTTATIKFSKSEESMAKLLLTFLDKDSVIKPETNQSFMQKLRSKVVKEIVLNLNSSSITKEEILSMLSAMDDLK